ncbi:hypothetical protein FPRO05_14203 [Fusarium proliferatum]|uniref:Uncharacterized protein n=1 Tax=Gibberella intermedia TaxID=948311 RepID=A0A365MTK5_GIBIN|nr:hypothetical protein FPRO05_14203 [Fusarium proliferatum]
MATSWPQEVAWPAKFREHATQLGKYLREALLRIERARDQLVPQGLGKVMAMGALSLVNKIRNIPDHRTRRALNGKNRIEGRGGKHDAGSQRY